METHFDELREYKDPEIIQCFIVSCEYFEPDYGNLEVTWYGLVGCCKGVLLIKHAFSQTKSFSKFTVFGAAVLIIRNSGLGAIIFDFGKNKSSSYYQTLNVVLGIKAKK